MRSFRLLLVLAFGATVAAPALAAVPGSIEVTCDVDRKAFRSAAALQAQVTFRLWPTPTGGSPCGPDYVVPMSGLVVFKAKTDRFDAQRGRKFAQIRAVLGSDASPVQLCPPGQETWLDVTVGSTTLTCDFSATDPKVAVAPGRRRLVAVPFAGQAADVSARVYSTTGVSIPNGSAVGTALPFDAERWDTDNIHDLADPTKLTAKTPGKYLLFGEVEWASNAAGQRQLYIRLNGTQVLGMVIQLSGGAVSLVQSVATHYALNVNDYVELVVIQDSGGALNVVSGTAFEFGMVKLP